MITWLRAFQNKYLAVLFLISVSLCASAQHYTIIPNPQEHRNLLVDSSLGLPTDTLASAPNGSIAMKNGFLYYKSGFWLAAGSSGAIPIVNNMNDLVNYNYQNLPQNPSLRLSGNEKLLVSVGGYWAPGDGGGGLFEWIDTATVVPGTGGAITQDSGTVRRPRSITGFNPGRWFRIYSGPVNGLWFGMKPDGVTDNLVRTQNLIQTPSNIYVPKGHYYFSDSLQIKTHKTNIVGDGKFETYFEFAPNKKGFKVEFPGAQECYFEGFRIKSLSSVYTDTLIHGFISRSTFVMLNVDVEGFPGDGFNLRATIIPTDPYYGNTSLSMLIKCEAVYNGGHGFDMRGADASAMTFLECSSRTNGRGAFFNDGYLGNNIDHCHIASSGARTNNQSMVRYINGTDTGYYSAISSEMERGFSGGFYDLGTNKNINPATNVNRSQYWSRYAVAPEDVAFASVWDSTKTYLSSGGYMNLGGNNYSHMNACYSEGNEVPSIMEGNSTSMGGDQAGTFTTASFNHLGTNGQTFLTYSDFYRSSPAGYRVGLTNTGLNVNPTGSAYSLNLYYDSTLKVFRLDYDAKRAFEISSYSTSLSYLSRTLALTPYDVGRLVVPVIFMQNADNYTSANKFDFGSTTSTAVNAAIGDRRMNNTADTTFSGWVCTAAGTPGTWVKIKTGNDNFFSINSWATGARLHNFRGFGLEIDSLGRTRFATKATGTPIIITATNSTDSAYLNITRASFGTTRAATLGVTSNNVGRTTTIAVTHTSAGVDAADMKTVSSFGGFTNQVHVDSSHVFIVANQSSLDIKADSMVYSPFSTLSRTTFLNLPTFTDTNLYKPLARDYTGRIVQMPYWLGSGSSGTPMYYANVQDPAAPFYTRVGLDTLRSLIYRNVPANNRLSVTESPKGDSIWQSTLQVNVANLGTGTPDATKVLFGDSAWRVPTAGWALSGNSGTGFYNYLGTSDNRSLFFGTNGSKRVMIDSTGLVGINNLAPLYSLHIKNAAAAATILTEIGDNVNAFSIIPTNGSIVGQSFHIRTLGSAYYEIQAVLRDLYIHSSQRILIGSDGGAGVLAFQTAGGNTLVGTTTDNGGRLQIVAGAAGAGTAPEKNNSGTLNTVAEAGAKEYNNSFYETKNSGLRYGKGGVIFTAFADAGNTTTTETDLHTYTTPTSALATNGESITAIYSGLTVAHASNTRRIRLYFGGTLIFDNLGIVTSAVGHWKATVTIIRVSSTVIRAIVDCNVTTAGGGSISYPTTYTEVTGLTLSNTNILKITGTSSSSTNDIVLKMAKGNWEPAANN